MSYVKRAFFSASGRWLMLKDHSLNSLQRLEKGPGASEHQIRKKLLDSAPYWTRRSSYTRACRGMRHGPRP